MPMATIPKALGPPLLNGVPAAVSRLPFSNKKVRQLITERRPRAVRLGTGVLTSEDECEQFVDRLTDWSR
jgi:hypothetical protein